MARRIVLDPHQEQRRELWLALAKTPGMGYSVADQALAAFDAKFGEPSSTEIEVKVSGNMRNVGASSPAAEVRSVNVIKLTLSGPAGCGKTTLLHRISEILGNEIHFKGADPVKVVFDTGTYTESGLQKAAGMYRHLLVLCDEQE